MEPASRAMRSQEASRKWLEAKVARRLFFTASEVPEVFEDLSLADLTPSALRELSESGLAPPELRDYIFAENALAEFGVGLSQRVSRNSPKAKAEWAKAMANQLAQVERVTSCIDEALQSRFREFREPEPGNSLRATTLNVISGPTRRLLNASDALRGAMRELLRAWSETGWPEVANAKSPLQRGHRADRAKRRADERAVLGFARAIGIRTTASNLAVTSVALGTEPHCDDAGDVRERLDRWRKALRRK